jgi:ornithine cyclodeaminase/alanine dehydrogenase-like protein (mu-crystallin family)
MSAAIDALETAFAADTLPEAPLRSHLETPGGTLLMMPSHGAPGVGVKLVTLTPSNADRGLPFIHAAYVLFDPETQALRAVFDGAALTALRTGAVSGLATRHLAREDARRLVLYGAGVQARSHLDAMRAVRAIDELVVVGRGRENVDALVDDGGRTGRRGRRRHRLHDDDEHGTRRLRSRAAGRRPPQRGRCIHDVDARARRDGGRPREGRRRDARRRRCGGR